MGSERESDSSTTKELRWFGYDRTVPFRVEGAIARRKQREEERVRVAERNTQALLLRQQAERESLEREIEEQCAAERESESSPSHEREMDERESDNEGPGSPLQHSESESGSERESGSPFISPRISFLAAARGGAKKFTAGVNLQSKLAAAKLQNSASKKREKEQKGSK